MTKRKASTKSAQQAVEGSPEVAAKAQPAKSRKAPAEDLPASASPGLDWVTAVSGPADGGQPQDGDIAASTAERDHGSAAAVAMPFKLGAESCATTSALPALDRMNERLARRLRTTVEPLARTKLKVIPQQIQTLTFKEWQEAQSDFSSLSVMAFMPHNGLVGLVIEPMLISRLVDTYYGGSGNIQPTCAKEFTPTEEKMIEKLFQAWVASLEEVWREIVPASFRLRTRESNVGYATFARSEETMAVARFVFEFNSGQPSSIDLIYPIATLRHVERDLATSNKDEHGPRGHEWRRNLHKAVREIRFKARTVLARPDLHMSELIKLSPGDIIPVNLSSMVPLIVQEREIALGTIGEHNGRAAFKIEIMHSKDPIR